ncbi:MAG: cyclic nucleotide-binding domain-containing protein [Nitrospinae bacterium]|nr:cyclic nucleotide-binding domain-containing protein [Nitrospinota bacterium]
MDEKTFPRGQWLITEGNTPAYFIYRLKKGKVSIYTNGKKINEMEVREGDKPKLLGVIAAFRDDRRHTASVKTESTVEVEMLYVNHLKGVLKFEMPSKIRKDVDAVLESIQLFNSMETIKNRLAEIGKIRLSIPSNAHVNALELFDELKSVYERLLQNK